MATKKKQEEQSMNSRKKRAQAALKQVKKEQNRRQYAQEHKHIVGKYDVDGKPTKQRSGMYGTQRVYEYFTQLMIAAGVDEREARNVAAPILGIDNKILSRGVIRFIGEHNFETNNTEIIQQVYYSADVAEEDLQFDAETAIIYVQGFIDYAQQVAATLSTGAK